MSAVLIIRAEACWMRALGHLGVVDLLQRVDARAFGIEGVHKMHGCCLVLQEIDLLAFAAISSPLHSRIFDGGSSIVGDDADGQMRPRKVLGGGKTYGLLVMAGLVVVDWIGRVWRGISLWTFAIQKLFGGGRGFVGRRR